MTARTLAWLLSFASVPGCHSEERRYHEIAPARDRAPHETPVSFVPGPDVPLSGAARKGAFQPAQTNPYATNAWGIGEGSRWFVWFNCAGCHGNGGGGMGPPLMDASWRYGSGAREIFTSIMDGRPGGMPAFRGRINEQQAWQLVAYVRSVGGLTPRGAEPGRRDALHSSEPPSIAPQQTPYPEKGTP